MPADSVLPVFQTRDPRWGGGDKLDKGKVQKARGERGFPSSALYTV